MSWMAKLFGNNKAEKPLSPSEAIQNLRNVEEILIKKQEYLEKKVDAELSQAKKYGTKNKHMALAALKRKHRLEHQLKQLDGTLTTIEFQRESLENASTNTEVFKAMGIAAKSLKSAHSGIMDPDQVHDILEELREQQSLQDEINEALSNPLGADYDQDELEQELAAMMQEQFEEEAGLVQSIKLPSPPSLEPTASHSAAAAANFPKEDEDLKKLEAWAS